MPTPFGAIIAQDNSPELAYRLLQQQLILLL
jgi:hypothetical protein